MEYLIDLRFEDKSYNALVHFVATFKVKNVNEASDFVNELLSGFNRRNVIVFSSNYHQIDNDPILRQRSYEYSQFCQKQATASIQIEQFILEDPDQTKSLADNLIEKLFNGEKSTAKIGAEYNIPVRVLDKKTRNPISGEFYYFTIEHLIPNE
jgi:hypothetical protein